MAIAFTKKCGEAQLGGGYGYQQFGGCGRIGPFWAAGWKRESRTGKLSTGVTKTYNWSICPECQEKARKKQEQEASEAAERADRSRNYMATREGAEHALREAAMLSSQFEMYSAVEQLLAVETIVEAIRRGETTGLAGLLAEAHTGLTFGGSGG